MKPSFNFTVLLVSSTLLFCAFAATAQVEVQWDKTLGGNGHDVLSSTILTPDRGYLLSGFSYSPASGDKTENNQGEGETIDYWIVKTDERGNKLWDKTFGGNSYDYLTSTISTPDGGYLLAGRSTSPASGDKTQGKRDSDCFYEVGYEICFYDFWIVKIDEQGNKLWDKTLGGSGSDELTSTISTPDGGYLLAGSSSSPASGDKSEDSRGERDYWIVKIDEQGNKLWDKTLGGSGGDVPQSIILSPDGGYLLSGTSSSPASGDKTQASRGSGDYWIVKIDEQGNKIWDKTFGGSSSDYLSNTISTDDRGYLLSGTSYSPASGDKTQDHITRFSTDYWVVKIDERGNKLWDKTFGGSDDDELHSTILTPDGGYLLTGSSYSPASGDKREECKGYNQFDDCNSDYWIVKTDEQGNQIWDKTIGGSSYDNLSNTILTPDGGYLLSGYSSSPASGDKTEDNRGPLHADYWIVKVVETEEEAFFVRNLSLVNADTDEVIAHLQDGDEVNLSDLESSQLTIRANTTPVIIDSVKLEITNINHTQVEKHYPYALFGDDPKAGEGRDYIGRAWKPGAYKLSVTPYHAGRDGNVYRISFSVVVDADAFARIYYFVLVNADTDEEIGRLEDGDFIDLEALGNPTLSIRADPAPIKVDSVALALSGPFSHRQTERHYPYALFGDEPDGPRDYIGRQWLPGNYTLTATPYLNDADTPFINEKKGATSTISFSVTGSNSNARLAVYPVPTTGIVNITHKGTADDALLMLLDHSGNVVLEQPFSRQAQQLDLSSFRKGFYFLKVITHDHVQVNRIVVE